MDLSYARVVAIPHLTIPRVLRDGGTRGYTHAVHSPGVEAGVGHDTAHQNSTALWGKNTLSPLRAAGSGPKPWSARVPVVYG